MQKSIKRSKAIDCNSHVRYDSAEDLNTITMCKDVSDDVSFPMVNRLFKAERIEMLRLKIRNI